MEVVGYASTSSKKIGFPTAQKQIAAIRKFCRAEGYSLPEIFLDDYHERDTRLAPQFFNMLKGMLIKNIQTIIVDSLDYIPLNRAALDSMMVFLLSKGIRVIACGASTEELQLIARQPFCRERILMQQEFSKFDRDFENVKRVQARKEIRISLGKCEGRKSYKEVAPETLKEIRRLRRRRLGRKRRTYMEIAKTLNNTGYITLSGKEFTANNVSMIFHRSKTN